MSNQSLTELVCQRCKQRSSIGTYYGGEKPLHVCGFCAEVLGIDPERGEFVSHELFLSAGETIQDMRKEQDEADA